MTDDPKPSNIVPFGKYKGRLLEEVLADDPAYIEWLTGQDWFRTKFTVLHQVIINRGAEPEETPEHNAMQVKFLDDEFCLRFLRRLEPRFEQVAFDALDSWRKSNLATVQKAIPDVEKMLQNRQERLAREQSKLATDAEKVRDDRRYAIKLLEEQARDSSAAVARLRSLQEVFNSPLEIQMSFERDFEERGIDVKLVVHVQSEPHVDNYLPRGIGHIAGRDQWCEHLHWEARRFRIELKPTIGDDYPAVLRQMKRTESGVLFVGTYTGRGATEEQFVKTFATAGIRVVFARELG
jgi:uncharacterized protein (DUF3820 family)